MVLLLANNPKAKIALLHVNDLNGVEVMETFFQIFGNFIWKAFQIRAF